MTSLLIGLSLITIACRPIQGQAAMPPAELLQLAAHGSEKHINALARNGGSGAWYALAEMAAGNGHQQLAQNLRKKSYRKDPAPFAGIALSKLLIDNPKALMTPLVELRVAEKRFGSDRLLRQAKIAVLDAFDRQKALSQEIESFSGEPWETPVLAAAMLEERDSFRLAGMVERFVLYVRLPSVLAHLPEDLPELVGQTTQILRSARMNHAAGDDSAALTEFAQWLDMAANTLPACELESPSPVFAEMAVSASRLRKQDSWATILQEAAASFTGAKRYAASYQAGKLLRSQQRYREATVAFATAMEAIPSGLDADRAIWYYLETKGKILAGSEVDEVYAYAWAAQHKDNAFRFTDVLEEFINRRVSRGEWALLESYYWNFMSLWADISRAHAALALGIATQEGLIDGTSETKYLEEAYAAAPLSWWGMRAAGLLGKSLSINPATGRKAVSPADKEIELFLKWGMVDRSATDIFASPMLYADQTIRRVAHAMSESNPRRSIHMIGLLLGREGYSPSREDLLLRFPLHYERDIINAAEKYDIPVELYYGLIRTESAWDATAVSRSGAMGLTQFMPATWEEWEKRLDYPEDSNPMDSKTSLAFGAAYLSWLHEREWTRGWLDVLISYNAGGGRLRGWREQRHNDNDDLFGMSIPIEEPRLYTAKVFSAATLYGYLYAGQTPKNLHEAWILQ